MIHLIIFIYLFIRLIPNPEIAGSARINAKEREKKERQVRKQLMRSYGMKNRNESIKKKKETGSGTPTYLPWTM